MLVMDSQKGGVDYSDRKCLGQGNIFINLHKAFFIACVVVFDQLIVY